jgi:hypothetical protein
LIEIPVSPSPAHAHHGNPHVRRMASSFASYTRYWYRIGVDGCAS